MHLHACISRGPGTEEKAFDLKKVFKELNELPDRSSMTPDRNRSQKAGLGVW